MMKVFLLTLMLLNFQARAQTETSTQDIPTANSEQLSPSEEDSWLGNDPGAAMNSSAENKKRRSALNSPEASVTTTKSKSSKYWQVGPRAMFWQEKIKATENGAPLVYNARFSAFAAAYSYKNKLGKSRRWLYAHEGDFIIGSVKASGTVASTTDNLNNLIFFGVQLSPGIAYRTASATLITFSTPIFYRKLSWDLGRPTLQLEGESVFDVGVGVHGSWRLGTSNYLTTGVTARLHSALWTIGLDFKL